MTTFPQEKTTMADHGHLRHFAKVLDTTEKYWNPTPEEDKPKFRENYLNYLLKQEEFHRVNLSRVRGMIAFLRAQED